MGYIENSDTENGIETIPDFVEINSDIVKHLLTGERLEYDDEEVEPLISERYDNDLDNWIKELNYRLEGDGCSIETASRKDVPNVVGIMGLSTLLCVKKGARVVRYMLLLPCGHVLMRAHE